MTAEAQQTTPETGTATTTGDGQLTAAEKPETGNEKQRHEIPAEVERAIKKANKEAETLRLKLKEYEDRDKTEQQKLADRATQAETKAAEMERESLRLRVAISKRLPADLAERLRGDTPEELEADADKLLALVAPETGAGPKPDRSQGSTGKPGATTETGNDMEALLRAAATGKD